MLLLSFIIMGLSAGYLISLVLHHDDFKKYHFLILGLVGGLLGRFVHVGFLDMPLGFLGDVIFCVLGSFALTEIYFISFKSVDQDRSNL